MMYWWGNQMTAWGWVLMSVSSVAFWALVIAVIVALGRYLRIGGADRRPEQSARPSPEQLLAERYARGEIDDAEYLRRLDTLEAAAGDWRSPSRP
ncbi:SHOCT domain-containing protein [Pseudonocardia xinjiangensis]|uniref:SHOCT domain-containing protein n=1 Tax=Pseudonocardia xinjiangensis TaxID=75289 RepID=UPI003D93E461